MSTNILGTIGLHLLHHIPCCGHCVHHTDFDINRNGWVNVQKKDSNEKHLKSSKSNGSAYGGKREPEHKTFIIDQSVYIQCLHLQIPLLNGSDTSEFINECDQTSEDGYTIQRKTSSRYILKNDNRKNRVEFVEMLSSERETRNLLTLTETN